MKPLAYHSHRLLQRWLEAESITDPERRELVLRKAEKHQDKVNRWHQKLQRLGLWNRQP